MTTNLNTATPDYRRGYEAALSRVRSIAYLPGAPTDMKAVVALAEGDQTIPALRRSLAGKPPVTGNDADPFAHLPLGLRPQAVMARCLNQAGQASPDATDTDRKARLNPEVVMRRCLAASGT